MAAAISPQPLAVGEVNQKANDTTTNNNPKQLYAARLNPNQSAANFTKTKLKPIEYIHGVPTIQFSMDEREDFAKEEGLHQAVVIKLSTGAPDLQVLRNILPKTIGIKGNCLIGSLAHRQILIRCDQYEDFVCCLARAVNYFQHNGKLHQYRVFPWSVGYNPKEETSKAAVWISLPNLSPELFARKALLSIATVVGKPIAIDKATQVRSRPSTARVKLIVDLIEKLPEKVRLQHVDAITGKITEEFQEIMYDNLPSYCCNCKRQGHEEIDCRLLQRKTFAAAQHVNDEVDEDVQPVEKLRGDARDFLNSKKQQKLEIAKSIGSLVDVGTGRVSHVLEVGSTKEKDNSNPSLTGTVGVVHSVPAGAFDRGDVLNEKRALKEGEGRTDEQINHTDATKVSKSQQGAHEYAANSVKTSHVAIYANDAAKIDKGPPKPTRDVPASTALARIFNAVNPIVQAYDKLDRRPSDAIDESPTKLADFNAKDVNQVQEHVATEGAVDTCSKTINKTSDGDEHAVTWLLKSTDALAGDHGPAECSNLEAAAALIASGDRSVTGVKPTTARADLIEKSSGTMADLQVWDQSKTRDWAVVNRTQYTHSKHNVSGHKTQTSAAKNVTVSNSFDTLMNEQVLEDVGNEKQQVHHEQQKSFPVSRSSKRKQDSGNLDLVVRRNDTITDLEDVVKEDRNHKMHFSSPQVVKIIKDTQIAMMMSANPMIKQPLVTLNTSVQDVPSQSLKSFGEHGSESGQMMIPTGNNNDVIQTNVRGMAIKSKFWAEQREEDDDEDWGDGFDVYSSEEADHETALDSAGEDLEAPAMTKNVGATTVSPKRNLNIHAPVFIPRNSPTGRLNQTAATFTNQLGPDAILTGEGKTITLRAGQQLSDPTSPCMEAVQQQLSTKNTESVNDGRAATVTAKTGQQQIVTITPSISLEERQLLDALVSPTPVKSTSITTLSSGRVSKSKDKVQGITQQRNKVVLVSKQDGNALVTQEHPQDLPKLVIVGRDTYEEGEEEDNLNQCQVEAARKGDLSPMHSGKRKNTHKREKSWDGRMSEDANVRRLPMRVAKQKQVFPTTSKKSNRSKKKS